MKLYRFKSNRNTIVKMIPDSISPSFPHGMATIVFSYVSGLLSNGFIYKVQPNNLEVLSAEEQEFVEKKIAQMEEGKQSQGVLSGCKPTAGFSEPYRLSFFYDRESKFQPV